MQNLVLIVKGVPGFGTPDDRKAIIESALGLSQRARDAVGSLDLNGSSDAVAGRVISHLASFGKLESGEETLELFLIKSVATKVDLDVGEEISNIVSRSRVIPPKPRWPPPPPGDFDPRIENVKRAIRTNLNKIKNCEILDENENEVWTLDLLATELECDAPQPGEDLREHLASFLTTRCIDTDLTSLVRVLKLLYKQGMAQDAERIGEIVDLMLPLCLPRKILSEAWRQIQDHGAVLIQTPVTKKTGADPGGRPSPQAGEVQEVLARPDRSAACSARDESDRRPQLEGGVSTSGPLYRNIFRRGQGRREQVS